MEFIDRCARRKELREILLKEFNENKPQKIPLGDKQSVSLCKRESPRSRFFKKDGNKVSPGDGIAYMPALKKAPNVKPDFILCKRANTR